MKPLYKFLVIPVACHALVCSQAMAKKDKSDDSDNKKNERTEDSSPKKRDQAMGPQGKKPGSGGNVNPQNNRPNAKPKQQEETRKKPPQQAKNKDVQPERKVVKPREDNPSPKMPEKKDVRPPKEDSNPPSGNKRKDEDNKDRGKDNDANGKRRDQNADKGTKDKKPMDLPGKRPDANKDTKDKKPMDLPGKRPGADKDTKDKKPMDLPGKRPGADKDTKDKITKDDKDKRPNKPMTLPGKRPKPPESDKTKFPNRKEEAKPDKKPDRPPVAKRPNNEPKKPVVVRPGQNTKKVRRVELENNNKTNNWWAHGNNVNSNNKDVRIYNNNKNVTNVTNVTQVNNNFRQNVNWSTHRNNWGYNPWWNRPATRPWYGSSWNGGWSSSYYTRHYHHHHDYGYRPPGYHHNEVASAIGWGLIGWSLGTMIYDTGYRSYYNPYQARPVYVSNNTQVTYTEPITQVAVRSAPKEDASVQEITRKSETFIGESQTAFKQRNYLVALELADKAIAESPGDGALHEYRALVLFALGKYGEAAGVLNPVLASGPGWDWSTMIALYDSQQTYTDQLQKLEAYTEEKPDSADTHFLLGYHYMVCGHLDLATPQFDEAVRIMPKDSVSKELAELTRNSEKTDEEGKPKPAEAEAEPEAEAPDREPVPLEKLTGTWVSDRDPGSSITLTFKDDGKFTWSYLKDGKATEFGGEYSMNDDGLLVLDSSESQMVANVELPQETELKFVLAGGPPEDPGLAFKKN